MAETVTRRTGVPFLPGYGASEIPVLAVNPVHRPDAWRLDSVGFPPAGVVLRVVDLETGSEVAPGVAGEIQGRSPSVMLGYLPEEANDDAFDDGWYRTGDVGWVEPEGWLHLTDRVKEMIKVKGFQVAPAEVEAVLHGHPDVVDRTRGGCRGSRWSTALGVVDGARGGRRRWAYGRRVSTTPKFVVKVVDGARGGLRRWGRG